MKYIEKLRKINFNLFIKSQPRHTVHILGYHRLFLAMNLSEWGSLSGSHFGMVKVIVSLRFEIHHSTAYNGSISAFGY